MARNVTVGMALLFVMSAIVYRSLWHAGFVYDDLWTVVRNPALQSFSLKSFFLDADSVAFSGSGMARDIYRPLSTLSLALDFHVWHLSPRGYHLINILLHLLNACLLVWISKQWLNNLWGTLVVAAVFLVHPVQIEAVAWVTQRSTLLCALGCLSALAIYLKKKPLSKMWIAAGLLCYAVALFSKETAVLLPVLAILIDQKRHSSLLFSWVVMAILYWMLRGHVLGQWSSIASTHPTVLTQGYLGIMAFPIYLKTLLLPVSLTVTYSTPMFEPTRFLVFLVIDLSYLGVLGVAIFRRNVLAIPLGWILIMLIPVLHLIPIVPFVADRFLYIPVMGFALAIGWLAQAVPWARQAVCAWIAALGLMANATVPVWVSDSTLWAHAVSVEPQNAFAHAAFAETLGETPLAEEEYFKVLVNHPSQSLRYAACKNLAYWEHVNGHWWKADFWRLKAEELRLGI